jgi:hypothetical protein
LGFARVLFFEHCFFGLRAVFRGDIPLEPTGQNLLNLRGLHLMNKREISGDTICNEASRGLRTGRTNGQAVATSG